MTDTQGILLSVFQDSPFGFGFGHLIGTFFIPSETSWLETLCWRPMPGLGRRHLPEIHLSVMWPGVPQCASHCNSVTHCQCHTALVCHVAGVARVRGAPPLLSLHHWPARFSNQVLLLIKRPDSNNCACLHF